MRKILFVTGKDVHNKSAFVIYKELVKRGYEVEVYATTLKDNHTLLFEQAGVKIGSVEELYAEKVMLYDYIFSAVPLYHLELFRTIRKYIFLNPSTFLDEVYFSGDFIFAVRDISTTLTEKCMIFDKINYVKSLPAMVSGGATFIKEAGNISKNHTVKSILFIDSGHFPFGTKKELAEYIIQIANSCSNCDVYIKPRYLPSDVDTTHNNKENVIVYLDDYDNLPTNLHIIREHTDLQYELKKCDLVICSEGTSSYIEAILHNKKLIIFTGFPSEEGMLWTNHRRRLFLEINKHIPNRVHYKDIFNYLPEGINTRGDELDGFLYSTSHVAENIVDAMEYIFENGISKGRFPKNELSYIDKYKSYDMFDSSITWEEVLQRRYKSILYDRIGSKTFRICSDINCDTIIDYVRKQNCSEDTMEQVIIDVEEMLYDVFIDNNKRLMADEYSQSLLCLAYYKKGRFFEFKPDTLMCNAYYNYCLAKIEYDRNDYEKSLKYIELYFDEVNGHMYEVSFADDIGVIVMAYYYKGAALFKMGKYSEAKEYLTVCDKAWAGKHIKAKEFLAVIDS